MMIALLRWGDHGVGDGGGEWFISEERLSRILFGQVMFEMLNRNLRRNAK